MFSSSASPGIEPGTSWLGKGLTTHTAGVLKGKDGDIKELSRKEMKRKRNGTKGRRRERREEIGKGRRKKIQTRIGKKVKEGLVKGMVKEKERERERVDDDVKGQGDVIKEVIKRFVRVGVFRERSQVGNMSGRGSGSGSGRGRKNMRV